MKSADRRAIMRVLADAAYDHFCHEEFGGRSAKWRECSRLWRVLATDAEARRAPKYLQWPGRE